MNSPAQILPAQKSSSATKPGWKTIVGLPLGLAVIMTPAVLLASGVRGGGGGFNAVVHAIESRYHAHATRIPLMFLVSGVARIATHGGVGNLHVAEFEHFSATGPVLRSRCTADCDHDDAKFVDGDELLSLVEHSAGKGWSRMIRETSRDGGEQTLIYVRDEGRQVGMLVVDLDHHDLNVVQISMNPDRLFDEVREHRGHHHSQDNDKDTDPNSDPASSDTHQAEGN